MESRTNRIDMILDKVRDPKGSGPKYTAFCPSHDDLNGRSLSIDDSPAVMDVVNDGMPTYLASLIAPLLIRPLLRQSVAAYPGTLADEEAKDLLDFLEEWRFPGHLTEKVIPLLKSRLGVGRKLALKTGRSGSSSGRRSMFARAKMGNTVEDVAARFTDLLPSGVRGLRGLCPLHSERSPSFYIDQDAQRWRCFGACGVGGDVIELVRRLMEIGIWTK